MGKIIRAAIDLSQVTGYIDNEEQEIILAALERSSLLDDGFLYTFFDFQYADQSNATGLTTRGNGKTVYAFARPQLVWDNGEINCVRERIKEVHPFPGLAVYDGAHLVPSSSALSQFGYDFKNPKKAIDALRGIAEIVVAN